MAVGELVLIVSLLVSAHCEVRARDPEVEEGEEERGTGSLSQQGQIGAFGALIPTNHHHLPHVHRPEAQGGQKQQQENPVGLPNTVASPPEGGNYPARTGNWCAFVHRREHTMAVLCGTEKYTIKSQSPCPSGTPDCQLVMYKLSTRPVYRQEQRISTALLWRCCPGYGGEGCEDIVPDGPEAHSENSALIGRGEQEASQLHPPGLQYQFNDPSQEQNDHHASVSFPNDSIHSNHTHSDPAHRQDTPPHGDSTHHLEPGRQTEDPQGIEDVPTSGLPLPHTMALLMSQLQPVLEDFRRTLQQLSQQVEELSRDVAQLRSKEQENVEEVLGGSVQDQVDAKLSKTFRLLQEELHSQHAMVQHNLSSLQTRVDLELKQNQQLLQVSLQAVNSSLSELKLNQEQLSEELQRRGDEESPAPPFSPLLLNKDPVWEAIERLDNMVVNNTVKVSGLLEDVHTNTEDLKELTQGFSTQQEQIVQTGRNSQIQFMETGLEVEAAKVAVLSQVGELAGNLSLQTQQLEDVEVHIDYLYSMLNNTAYISADCNCRTLKEQMSRLEQAVTNVTQLSKATSVGRSEVGDWKPVVEALQLHLQQVKRSLVFEQARSRELDNKLTGLNGSLAGSAEELLSLRKEMRHLSSSFNSLLKDAVRHSDVLEILLGEEVLEFLDWPPSEQETHSVPALQETIAHLQQQLSQHSHSITKLLGGGGSNHEHEKEAADQPSSSHLPDWLSSSLKRSGGPIRQHQLLQPEGRNRAMRFTEGRDLWNLEKAVEELGVKVHQLEEQPCCNASSREEVELQVEVQRLRGDIEDHLQLFKSVFSNTEHLEHSDARLDLHQLWALLKKGEGRRQRRRKEAKEVPRSRRDKHGPPGSPADLLLLASLQSVQPEGLLLFKASVNQQQVYSEAGTFLPPADGAYLFLLSLDLQPGHAHVVMKTEEGSTSLLQEELRTAGPVTGLCLLLLRERQEVTIQLSEGGLTPSKNNILAMLLLGRTT